MIAAIAAQGADLVTFAAMVAVNGPAAEANPLVRGLLVAFGPVSVVGAKVALMGYLVALQALATRGPRATAAGRRWGWLVALAGLLAGAIGAVSNARVLWP